MYSSVALVPTLFGLKMTRSGYALSFLIAASLLYVMLDE